METFSELLVLCEVIHRWPVDSHHKASDTELWYVLWSASEQTVEQRIETPVIWDVNALIMMSFWWVLGICTVHAAASIIAMIPVASVYRLCFLFSLVLITIKQSESRESHKSKMTPNSVTQLTHNWFKQWLCGLFGTKSIPESMLTYCQSDSQEKNFSEIRSEIQIISFKKRHVKMSSANRRPFCSGFDLLNADQPANRKCNKCRFT